jgi:predicted glycosyltransferase
VALNNVMFYCQHLLGMGHLVRSGELVRALACDWKVTFVVGGGLLDGLSLPPAVNVVSLPALESDPDFQGLHPVDNTHSLEEIQAWRREQLLSCFRRVLPEVLIIELFPFGRKQFAFELMPLLDEARNNGTRVVCSLRDILVRRQNQDEYEARVCEITQKYFDLILIHADPHFQTLDESFSRMSDLGCPVAYTGYVGRNTASANRPEPAKFRRPTIVGSIGAGKCESGHRLLEGLIAAAELLDSELPHKFQIFTGPFMPERDRMRLQGMARNLGNATVSRYTPDLPAHLRAADLSVSMGGYNTIMDVLRANARALVYPVTGNGDSEQAVRAAKLAAMGAIETLETRELVPRLLASRITNALRKPTKAVSLDMDGSETTRRLIHSHFAPAEMAAARG